MNTDFFKTDLHIHTPASKCYKGIKDDEEYFRILEAAVKKELKIIAFTDHNTIAGYKKLMQIKEKLYFDKITFERLTDSHQAKENLKIINKKMQLFEKLIIFPGVEFEVSNCV
ncbi:MAG: hypothetical protein NTU73_01550, partial [Ignavibacteriae bacterium]|nr:hypothetical protein [Ignavibacteriota bacterium]